MTKDEVMKFLDTATPEVFAEIRERMTKIRRDREYQEDVMKKSEKRSRRQKVFSMYNSGMSFEKIGEIYKLSAKRCEQIYEEHLKFGFNMGLEMAYLEDAFKRTVEHYAQMAMNPGSIDHARHMVKMMEKDKSGMWEGLSKAVANRINELKETK